MVAVASTTPLAVFTAWVSEIAAFEGLAQAERPLHPMQRDCVSIADLRCAYCTSDMDGRAALFKCAAHDLARTGTQLSVAADNAAIDRSVVRTSRITGSRSPSWTKRYRCRRRLHATRSGDPYGGPGEGRDCSRPRLPGQPERSCRSVRARRTLELAPRIDGYARTAGVARLNRSSSPR